MAEQDNTIRPGISGVEDTRTRKTVRLTPAANAPMVPIDPTASAQVANSINNTSTGNLEMFTDTQTRRTVKLKPLTAPGAAPVSVAPVAPAPAPAAPAAAPAPAVDDTSTRKATVVRPAPMPTPAVPGVAATPQSSTLKLEPLRPAPAPAAPAPAPAPAAPAAPAPAPAADDTSTRKATVVRPAATPTPAISDANQTADDGNSRTVRIQRPNRPPQRPGVPAAAPNMKLPASKPAAPAAPAAPAPAPAAPAAKPTPPKPAPAVAKPEPPKAAGDIGVKKPGSDDPKVNVPGAAAPKAKDAKNAKDNALKLSGKNKPSGFYLALAVLTLIVLIGTAVMTTLHYVKFEHQLDYTHLVPGLPGNNK